MQRLDPDAPVYAFAQPDGTSITLDLSTPDALGDFAMEIRLPDDRRQHGSVYHSGEPGLFIAVLRCWAHVATPGTILAGIDWVRNELATMTKGREATTDSENTFDHDLALPAGPLGASTTDATSSANNGSAPRTRRSAGSSLP